MTTQHIETLSQMFQVAANERRMKEADAISAAIDALRAEAGAVGDLVAAAKRLDTFSLVILSSVNVEDPQFTDRVGAALADLRNAAHTDPDAVKYRKALERIFECGMYPEGHHDAGDHEFCGSHHADCIAIARDALAQARRTDAP